MVTIVTRAGKGSPLDHVEMDANFTNLKGAIEAIQIPQRSVIVNSGPDIWTRGTQFLAMTTTTRIGINWKLALTTAGTWQADASTDVPPISMIGRKLEKSLLLTCTSAHATVSAADAGFLTITVEGREYARLYQQAQAIGICLKVDVPGTYCVAVRNSGGDRSYVSEVVIEDANEWNDIAIPITAIPSGGTWNFTNGEGAVITLGLISGSNHHTATTNAWVTGNYRATSNQVNVASAAGNKIYIAEVVLVAGTDPSNVQIPLHGEIETYSQRYYYLRKRIFLSGKVNFAAGNNLGGMGIHPVPMRTSPASHGLTSGSSWTTLNSQTPSFSVSDTDFQVNAQSTADANQYAELAGSYYFDADF